MTVDVTSPHPLVVAGGWAVALMAGRDHPSEVTDANLTTAVARIAEDAATAARAGRDTPGWAWQLALAALFHNSPATHPLRSRWDEDEVRDKLADLFTPDDPATGEPCVLCGRHASVYWSNNALPLVHRHDVINNRARGRHADPVCRACRVCVWAAPYGGHATGQSLMLLTPASVDGADVDEVMRRWTSSHLTRAGVLARAEAVGGGGHSPAWSHIASLVAAHPTTVDVTTLRNDPRDPWILISQVPADTGRFLAGLARDVDAAQSWAALVDEYGDRAFRTLTTVIAGEHHRSMTSGLCGLVDDYVSNSALLNRDDHRHGMTALLLAWLHQHRGADVADLAGRAGRTAAYIKAPYSRSFLDRTGLIGRLARADFWSVARSDGPEVLMGMDDLVRLYDEGDACRAAGVMARWRTYPPEPSQGR